MKLRVVALTAAALLLTACGTHEYAAAKPGVRTVRLTARYSHWSREQVRVPAGSVVRFVVRNDDPIDHELIIGDDAVQARHEQGTEPRHPPRPGEMTVPAGTTAETQIALDRPGRYVYACHTPGHFAYGMHGTIDVT